MSKKKINVCVIGCGNITNTRHIPALKKLRNVRIIGAIGSNQKNVEETCKKMKIKSGLLVNDPKNDIKKVEKCEWFKSVDAVVIGTPPSQHFPLAKMSLLLGKNVLIEKPMTMNIKEANELTKLAKEKGLVLNVVHNFNFTSGMSRINKWIESKKYGKIISITEVQLTNRDRRLPKWYNNLPLGLFYDEAAHFIYLLLRHGGDLDIKNVNAIYNKDSKDKTPRILSVNVNAGNIPTHMYLNFDSPVCEWYYVLCFKKRIIYYDLFKDIVISLPTDKEHYSLDVLKNDLSRNNQYWLGFVKNGFKRILGRLLYGHETVLRDFIKAVESGKINEYMDSSYGIKTVDYMNQIVERVNKYE